MLQCFLKIVCFRKNINGDAWTQSSHIYLMKLALNPKSQIFFFSNLKLWYLGALQPFGSQGCIVPHLKKVSIFFLKHTIFKRCVAVLLTLFMWAQCTLILRHKMVFHWFWLNVSVCLLYKQNICGVTLF